MRTALVLVLSVFVLLLTTVSSAVAESPGDLVLGKWGDGRYYPARVASTDGGKTLVAFYDGDVGTLDAASLKSFDWKVGSKVECNWKRQGKYYPGTIADMTGEVLSINYDDGDKEQTGIGRCRSK